MHSLIREHAAELGRLCAKYNVQRLDLFGSATGEGFDPAESDLDFLVEFQDIELDQYAECYFGLLEALQALFQRPVDLVMASAIKNPYFLRSIASQRVMLYAA
jgi:uncharacterized protein